MLKVRSSVWRKKALVCVSCCADGAVTCRGGVSLPTIHNCADWERACFGQICKAGLEKENAAAAAHEGSSLRQALESSFPFSQKPLANSQIREPQLMSESMKETQDKSPLLFFVSIMAYAADGAASMFCARRCLI